MKYPKLFSTFATASAVSFVALSAPAAMAQAPSFGADGRFSVCVDPTFPPMEFVEAGGTDPVGVDVDVTRALAAHWGVEPAFVVMDFNGQLPSLAAEHCDAVISGATLTEERQKTFDAVGKIVADWHLSPNLLDGLK